MPTFTPPTRLESRKGDRLFSRFGMPTGQSVVRIDGTYRVLPFPTADDLVGVEGVDFFMGGRTYQVTSTVAIDLDGDGFDVTGSPGGYGEGRYGGGRYGQ